MKKILSVFLCLVVLAMGVIPATASPSTPPHTPLMGIDMITGEEIPIEVELGDVFYSEGQKHHVIQVWQDGSFGTEVISDTSVFATCPHTSLEAMGNPTGFEKVKASPQTNTNCYKQRYKYNACCTSCGKCGFTVLGSWSYYTHYFNSSGKCTNTGCSYIKK